MTPREKLAQTSCESLLACLRDRLRVFEKRLDDAYCEPNWGGVESVMHDLAETADAIDLKIRMEGRE